MAVNPKQFLAALPPDRRDALSKVRQLILRNLPDGYEEVASERFLTYQVPLSIYPDTYNKQPLMYAALASQKNHMALYLCGTYGSRQLRRKLEEGFRKEGKKLDMGAACVRFRKLEDLALDVLGDEIAALPMARFVAAAKAVRNARKKR